MTTRPAHNQRLANSNTFKFSPLAERKHDNGCIPNDNQHMGNVLVTLKRAGFNLPGFSMASKCAYIFKYKCTMFQISSQSICIISDSTPPLPTAVAKPVRAVDRDEYIEQLEVVDYSSMKYFEPYVDKDFPTVSADEPRIPHIIHQIYNDDNIPVALGEYVRTMVTQNPKWKYYFWTSSSARKLVAERYPQLLRMWDSYKSVMNRADAIRYIILYEFGGFYADLDVSCLRPLDNITMKYACIFPTEPFEHSVFRLRVPYLINNAIMLCRPKHPFLKQMIQSLHHHHSMIGLIDVAGPSFVTAQYIRYNNITADDVYKYKLHNESNSPYLYKGTLMETANDAIYVPNTQYFMKSLSLDMTNAHHEERICKSGARKRELVRKACNELSRRLTRSAACLHGASLV